MHKAITGEDCQTYMRSYEKLKKLHFVLANEITISLFTFVEWKQKESCTATDLLCTGPDTRSKRTDTRASSQDSRVFFPPTATPL